MIYSASISLPFCPDAGSIHRVFLSGLLQIRAGLFRGFIKKGRRHLEAVFFVNQAVKFFLLYMVQYGCGFLAVKKGVKVNYTRKINHFVLFFIPIYLDRFFAHPETFGLFIISSLFSISTLLIYIEPVRKRVFFINRMFASFDRPEDRPHTLLWLSTQIAGGFLVIVPMIMLYAHHGLQHLIMIPILINGIGDGLAEPVGVRFGRHKYRVYALFSKRLYHRTLEGSACVFLTSLVVIAFYHDAFTLQQWILALIAVPVCMTLAEALSPHTWDTPFLFLTGYLVVFAVSLV